MEFKHVLNCSFCKSLLNLFALTFSFSLQKVMTQGAISGRLRGVRAAAILFLIVKNRIDRKADTGQTFCYFLVCF